MARAPLPEKTFPRGGRKSTVRKTYDADFSLFKSKKNKSLNKKKKKTNKKSSKNDETRGQILLKAEVVEDLSVRLLQLGFLALGRVTRVSNKRVQLSLPGSLRVFVNAASISAKYTSRIEELDLGLPTLQSMFTVGDFYPLAITSLPERGAFTCSATLDPRTVNSKLNLSAIKKGMVLTGSVLSTEDHGYLIDLGISNSHAFLKSEEVETGVEYVDGQLVTVVVLRVNENSILLSTVKKKFSPAKNLNLPIHNLVPGLKLTAVVKKVLRGGLEVSLTGFNTALKGFIHKSHLKGLFDSVTDYEINSEYNVTLLYVLPLLNYPFLKISDQVEPPWKLATGQIVAGKVFHVDKRGLVIKVGTDPDLDKVYVPLSKTDESGNVTEGTVNLKDVYPVNSEVPRVRIEFVSRFERCYVGSVRKATLEEPLYTVADVKVGKVYNVKINKIEEEVMIVEISSHLKGIAQSIHWSDSKSKKFSVGQVLKARVLCVKPNIELTLKSSLVKSVEPILRKYSDIKQGEAYLGTVVKIWPFQVLVQFYGKVLGLVRRRNMPLPPQSNIEENFVMGQTLKCFVLDCQNKRLSLSLVNHVDVSQILRIGREYKLTVELVRKEGIYVIAHEKGKTCNGFLPWNLMTQNEALISRLNKLYVQGDQLSGYCVHMDPMRNPPCLFASHPSISRFFKSTINDPSKLKLKVDAIMPFYYIPDEGDSLSLVPIVPYSHKLVFCPYFEAKPGVKRKRDSGRTVLKRQEFEVVIGKVVTIDSTNVTVATHTDQVWDGDFMSSLQDLDDYLHQLQTLEKIMTKKKKPIRRVKVADYVSGEAVSSQNGVTELTINGTLKGKCFKTYETGSTVKGRIVWIDYSPNVIWVYPKPPVSTKIETKSSVHARVVHVCPEVVVGEVSGSHELVFVPTRRHMNDHKTFDQVYNVGEMTKLCVFRLTNKLLGIDRQIVTKRSQRVFTDVNADLPELSHVEAKDVAVVEHKKRNAKKPAVVEHKKRNAKKPREEPMIEDEDSVAVEFVKEATGSKHDESFVKEEVFSEEECSFAPVVTSAEYDESDMEVKEEVEDDSRGAPLELSDDSSSGDEISTTNFSDGLDVGFNWSVVENPQLLSGVLSQTKDSDSSSEEEDENATESKKRKKLSGLEKKEKAKSNEERIRNIEENLLDPSRPPQNADDYDRLVMASPDDSSLWLKYMSYHLENTEIERARAVARRALKTISFREEQEKLNIWLALLNLEQLYGTPETQKVTFEEAARSNDPYKVHLHKLNLISEGGVDAEKMANAILRKYGDVEGVWWEVGGSLLKMGKLEFARNILQRGLASLPFTKHVNLITRFAQLENKYGSSERAQTLYEHVLSSFPKRVDVWSAYVDLMIKSDRIDLARQILERALSQSLPPKKIKTLYKKFVALEEAHGKPEDIERVRAEANKFLDNDAYSEDD